MTLIRYWPWLLVLAIGFASGFGLADLIGDAKVARVEAEKATIVAEHATALAASQQAAREAERRQLQRFADISEQHEARIRGIQAENDTRVGELVAGAQRLRREVAAYATASLSRDTAAAVRADPAAERGAALVSEAVGIGAECDATQRSLIEAYEAVRK